MIGLYVRLTITETPVFLSALDRREQLDALPEEAPRVRVERHDRRPEVRRARRLEDTAVPAMDAVEGADRDRPPSGVEIRGPVRDDHAAST